MKPIFVRAAAAALALSLLGPTASSAAADSIEVGSGTQQYFQGFGGSVAFQTSGLYGVESGSDPVRDDYFDKLFKDVPLTYLRMEVPTAYKQDADSPYDIARAVGPYVSPSVNGSKQEEVIAAARQRDPGLQICYTVWTPPYWMKVNNSANGSGGAETNVLSNGMAQTFADYCGQFAADFQDREGFPINIFSMQNEPTTNVPYDSCIYPTAADYVAELPLVATAVKNASPQTLIYGPELGATGGDDNTYFDGVLDQAGSSLDISAAHTYLSGVDLMDPSYVVQKPLFVTEFSFQGNDHADDGIDIAARTADQFVRDFNGGARAWFWWSLTDTETVDPNVPNSGREGEDLTIRVQDGTGAYTGYTLYKKYYVFKALANSFRYGCVGRAATSDSADLKASAAKNSDGTFVLVVSNSSSNDHSGVGLTFDDLSGGGSQNFTKILIDANNDYTTGTVTFSNGVYSDALPAQTVAVYIQQP